MLIHTRFRSTVILEGMDHFDSDLCSDCGEMSGQGCVVGDAGCGGQKSTVRSPRPRRLSGSSSSGLGRGSSSDRGHGGCNNIDHGRRLHSGRDGGVRGSYYGGSVGGSYDDVGAACKTSPQPQHRPRPRLAGSDTHSRGAPLNNSSSDGSSNGFLHTGHDRNGDADYGADGTGVDSDGKYTEYNRVYAGGGEGDDGGGDGDRSTGQGSGGAAEATPPPSSTVGNEQQQNGATSAASSPSSSSPSADGTIDLARLAFDSDYVDEVLDTLAAATLSPSDASSGAAAPGVGGGVAESSNFNANGGSSSIDINIDAAANELLRESSGGSVTAGPAASAAGKSGATADPVQRAREGATRRLIRGTGNSGNGAATAPATLHQGSPTIGVDESNHGGAPSSAGLSDEDAANISVRLNSIASKLMSEPGWSEFRKGIMGFVGGMLNSNNNVGGGTGAEAAVASLAAAAATGADGARHHHHHHHNQLAHADGGRGLIDSLPPGLDVALSAKRTPHGTKTTVSFTAMPLHSALAAAAAAASGSAASSGGDGDAAYAHADSDSSNSGHHHHHGQHGQQHGPSLEIELDPRSALQSLTALFGMAGLAADDGDADVEDGQQDDDADAYEDGAAAGDAGPAASRAPKLRARRFSAPASTAAVIPTSAAGGAAGAGTSGTTISTASNGSGGVAASATAAGGGGSVPLNASFPTLLQLALSLPSSLQQKVLDLCNCDACKANRANGILAAGTSADGDEGDAEGDDDDGDGDDSTMAAAAALPWRRLIEEAAAAGVLVPGGGGGTNNSSNKSNIGVNQAPCECCGQAHGQRSLQHADHYEGTAAQSTASFNAAVNNGNNNNVNSISDASDMQPDGEGGGEGIGGGDGGSAAGDDREYDEDGPDGSAAR